MHRSLFKIIHILLRILLPLLLLAGSISLIRSTAAQGTDFFVFWHAAKMSLQGEPLYSTARDGGMVFKYPPWILPFFIPFGILPLEVSKWIWGALQVISLWYTVQWLRIKMKIRLITCIFSLIFFWGIWIVHALDGQCSLEMLALALGYSSVFLRPDIRSFTLVIALSTKIFTLFPLFALKWSFRSIFHLSLIGFFLLLLSIPATLCQGDKSPLSLLQDWKKAATSSGELLNAAQIRGRSNPGLPGYTLRLLKIPAENSSADIIAALFFSFTLGFSWLVLSRNLQQTQKWIGWLALVPVVHPLPWWHLFAFSFPLTTYVLDASFLNKKKLSQGLSILGLLLITSSTEKLLGNFGIFLEFNAAKSWGVLCCAASLLFLQPKQVLIFTYNSKIKYP